MDAASGGPNVHDRPNLARVDKRCFRWRFALAGPKLQRVRVLSQDACDILQSLPPGAFSLAKEREISAARRAETSLDQLVRANRPYDSDTTTTFVRRRRPKSRRRGRGRLFSARLAFLNLRRIASLTRARFAAGGLAAPPCPHPM